MLILILRATEPTIYFVNTLGLKSSFLDYNKRIKRSFIIQTKLNFLIIISFIRSDEKLEYVGKNLKE